MADAIIVPIPTKLKPWSGPNFANSEDGEGSIAIRDLPLNALNALAQAWIDDLYKRAGFPAPTLRHGTPETPASGKAG